eukprot:13713_1
MFAARFNLPTSTTTNAFLAMDKFSSVDGLVLRLCKYRQIYDVWKLDCSALSSFDEEAETLFFGGNTVLKISSICKYVKKWTWYTKYIEPINAILRLIHGLSLKIKGRVILSKNKDKQTMYELINHLFCKSILKLPLYIEKLLKYHMSTPTIKLNFSELISDYKWLNPIFIKHSENHQLLDICNICRLFCDSNRITFCMPHDYILNYAECTSFIEQDLPLISAMDINLFICFEWPLEMPKMNKSRLNEYQQQLSKIKWNSKFLQNSVLFQCAEISPLNTLAVQQMVESHLNNNDQENADDGGKTAAHVKIMIDNGSCCILIIEGFVNKIWGRLIGKTYLPSRIRDLIALMYTTPKFINLYDKLSNVHTVCEMDVSWRSACRSIIVGEYSDKSKWTFSIWTDTDVFDLTIYGSGSHANDAKSILDFDKQSKMTCEILYLKRVHVISNKNKNHRVFDSRLNIFIKTHSNYKKLGVKCRQLMYFGGKQYLMMMTIRKGIFCCKIHRNQTQYEWTKYQIDMDIIRNDIIVHNSFLKKKIVSAMDKRSIIYPDNTSEFLQCGNWKTIFTIASDELFFERIRKQKRKRKKKK